MPAETGRTVRSFWPPEVGAAAADLLLGLSCAGCGGPGRALCGPCASCLGDPTWLAWPEPVPPGLVPTYAAGVYAATLRRLVLAYKEHARLALRAPLGDALARAVQAAAGDDRAGPVLLVPVPSSPGATRRRGHDPVGGLARRAAAGMGRPGRPARVRSALRLARPVADQAGLSAADRAANVAGVMVARPGRLGPARIVLVDDVVTTGATLVEAARALRAGGGVVVGAAVVAATPRYLPVATSGIRPSASRSTVGGSGGEDPRGRPGQGSAL